jgi:hypothetical protein
VVHATAEAAERADRVGLTPAADPTFGSILRTGLPLFLLEGFLPLGVFYAAFRLGGTDVAIVASAVVSLLVYARERRAGREGLLVRISLLFVAGQTAIGLLSHSATAYLAAPVLANALWGLVFLGSAAVGRPLAGALACAWYPFPPEFRRRPIFKRVYGIESVVWGLYLLGRSGLRLFVLLREGVGGFLLVNVATGTPVMLGLVAWSIWYSLRRLTVDEDAADRAPA